MFKAYLKTAFFALVFTAFATATAQEQANDHSNHSTTGVDDAHYGEGDAVNTKDEVAAFIDHHLQDSHYFTLFEKAEDHFFVSLPLPVLLWDDGVQMFMASKFHHDETIAEHNGNYYKMYHGKIYKTDAAGTITLDDHDHPTQTKPFDFSITKNVVVALLVGLIMFLLFRSLAKQYKTRSIPKGIGRVLEPLVIYVRDEIAKPNVGEKKYRKFMGFLLTVFFFIWIANLLGLTPLGTNLTGNIAVTVGLALLTYLITTFSANKDYWKHIFWMPGVHPIMKIFFIPIELLGTLTKPFALLVRLYANITAGHVVLFTLLGAITVAKTDMDVATGASIGYGIFYFILACFITLIELLVAFLQAYIFTLLSALFIGMAVADHDHHHEEEPEDVEADVEDVRERFV
ncbi:F-type H+-transporting ATPase subunit a [Nonlabens dokdonensis]|uniref:ATP synthase subunit a n=2 Tax=Nonlabens dokdonensis TaxID=328515 RepID=L7W9G1_NONDD|nr:F0F1 ATP synthase subunit A [Nonlabens dokdonensis]AGC76476.1 ATP synthase F0, A subunit [Nonlabens dokdonensis DSW-6]PZX44131.1 F-type H+-transporting ATPase subunit a [Nonlabens dokdonensis]